MELIYRTITGCLFVTLLVFCFIKGAIWFALLFALCTALTTWEFSTLMIKHKDVKVSKLWSTVASLLFFWAVFLICDSKSDMVIFLPFMLSLIIILVRELYRNKKNPILNIALSIMPILYIALPFSLLSVLAFLPKHGEYCSVIPLTLFFFLWSNDVGAYCIGCSIGKHKLFERISPKKTWEGTIGGTTVTIITAILLYSFVPSWYKGFPLYVWIGMAVTIALFGTWGDLVESMIKRELGVKDSGRILPGHGGMLDRFDSSLLAIPATVIYFCTILFFA